MNRTPLSCLRSDIKEQYLNARKSISRSSYREFLLWCKKQINQAPELRRQPVYYDELWGVFVDAPVVPLETELAWIAERLSIEYKSINYYLLNKSNIERAIFQNRAKKAIELQEEQFRKIGASLYGVQLRMALEHLAGGIDRQKKYSSEVRSIYKNGLLRFIGFYSSMRNETQSNITSYLATVKSRIAFQPNYSDSVKTYLRFHLTLDDGFTIEDLADILRVEQSHSLVDIYETFIRILQQLLHLSQDAQYLNLINNVLSKLDAIQDHRIRKLSWMINNSGTEHLYVAESKSGDALLSGNLVQSINDFRLDSRCGFLSPWEIIYAGIACSLHESKYQPSLSPRNVPFLLGRVVRLSNQYPNAIETLIKLLLNFRGIPALDGVTSFLKLLNDQFQYQKVSVDRICLDSPHVGPEDFGFFKDRIPESKRVNIAWSIFHNIGCYGKAETYGSPIESLFEAASSFSQNDFDRVIGNLNDFETYVGYPNAISVSLRLRALIKNDDRKELIRFIAQQCVQGGTSRKLIPVKHALSNFTKNDFKQLTDLSSLIALHLLWKDTKTPEDASNLRINIRRSLRRFGIDYPSQMASVSQDLDKQQVVYFLRYVCVLEFIDQIKAIDSTINLLEERQNICRLLTQLDPGNESYYADEIAEIEYKKLLEEGEWIVDRTRIHVDSDALKRWCKDNLSEDFYRYRSLINLSATAEDDVSDYLKDLFSGQIVEEFLDFPLKTEADQLLLTMVMEISEQFLKHPSFGLDFHLSKRIRHQSFIGLIRGPAEAALIITTKGSEDSEYHSNQDFLKVFDKVDAKKREHIDKAFKKFSRNFDDILTEAKDSYFQIYSQKTNPKGIIKLNLANYHIRVIQELTKGYDSFSDFVDTVESVLWGTLEPSLENARKYISEDLNHSLRRCFDELSGQVKSKVDRDSDAFRYFTNQLSQGYQGVSQMLENACGWFTRLSPSHRAHELKLNDMIQIAVTSSLKACQNLVPNISYEIEDNGTLMDAANTVSITDVIFVAFGNIRNYSGLDCPDINVIASVDEKFETLSISIENNLKFGIRKDSEPRLKQVLKQIDDRSYGNMTRKENRSGLIKLAAGAHQHTKGSVNAYFIDDSHFRMDVVYQLISRSDAPE